MLRITCLVLLSIFFIVAIIFIVLLIIYPSSSGCKPTITTASGEFAVSGEICAGNLIFEENFETLDKRKWQPEVTFWGGGNGEFEWYTADDVNSFVKNKKLYIKPTLTANKIGYDAVEHGYVRLDDCTDPDKTQCERQAGGNIIINPVQSARLTTEKSFSFKYGRVEVIAKLPTADYLWPAVWLMPRVSKYGLWPRSGEIDLMESRGNNNYTDLNGIQFGAKRTTSTLHFGPSSQLDKWQTSTYAKINETGFNNGFHIYEFIWNEKGFIFYVDRAEIGSVPVGDGFWKRGDFQGNDIWASGTKMAPFDQKFHFIINLAVGGTTNYFPSDFLNENGPKPWNDTSPSAMKDFWANREQWLPTWDLEGDDSSLIVDSIKVWAA
ncbi:beta-1,3-glucan-binding protein-like [Sitodiplosis mosellana]|uniref:beta-1,3-glucan-binding protein-like n=1 Tax=Sitodiplosis mosellana TaxID=263140 RepID=UPI002443BDAB|nr:beta-1,3-glucan-binding protein-like [Sitodiplosis mosellana]